ncbi:hypothetical protein ACT3UJ_06740 [Halomonas sp. 86]|uniref:hypothetical protein n=1 Tax=unclassified Halomonas TaxID=2609666 RepID=UPI0040337853
MGKAERDNSKRGHTVEATSLSSYKKVGNFDEVLRVKSCKEAREELVSNSVSDEFRHALHEWRHDGLCQNMESRIAVCALSKEKLRFAFHIRNSRNGSKLWVGLQALLWLNIPIYDRDQEVAPASVKSYLRSLVQNLVNQEAIARCVVEAMVSNNEPLAHALIQYSKDGVVSPYEASLIFNAIEESGIITSDVMLRIHLRRAEDIDQLKAIPTWSLWRFWHCLTSDQVRLALEFNHRPPGTEHGTLVQYKRDDQVGPMSEECGNLLRD